MEWKEEATFSLHPKPVNTLESGEIHFQSGKSRELSNVSGLGLGLPDINDMICPPSKGSINTYMLEQAEMKTREPTIQKKKKESVTAESQHVPSQMISSDKLSSCSPNIQPLKLSETLARGLTGSGKVFSSFSREQLREISRQLWYPIETDLQGSDLNCSNGCLTTIESNSWFSNRRLEVKNPSFVKTCYPLSTSFPVGPTEQEDTQSKKKEKKLKTPKKTEEKTMPRRCCQFALTKKINGIVYGTPCGTVLLNARTDENGVESPEEDVCPEHSDKKQPEFEKYWSFTCEFIIKKRGTGVEEARNRKGLPCGKFCDENERYCKYHAKIASKPKDPILRCIKVRARPTKQQKKELEKWFGDKRKTYNLMVDERLENELKETTSAKEKKEMEGAYKLKHVTDAEEYLKETPREIRSGAVSEYFTGVCNAINLYIKKVKSDQWRRANWTDYRPKEIKHPEMHYQLKNDQQSIALPSMSTSIGLHMGIKSKQKNAKNIQRIMITVYPRSSLGPVALDRRVKRNKTLNRIFETGIQYDYRLLKTKTGKYYFCLPYSAVIEPNNSTMQAASDGGVRNFQTVYSPQGGLEQYGHNANINLRRIQTKISTLRSSYFNAKLQDKKHIKGFIQSQRDCRRHRLLLQEKIRNLVSDLHYKTANSLCKKYGTIILPHFATKNMIRSTNTGSYIKREMLALAHGAFRNRLISKAELTATKLLIPENEFQTTMTCGICFEQNRNVGDSEVFNCEKCGLRAGRDVNAPRNIFIRQLIL